MTWNKFFNILFVIILLFPSIGSRFINDPIEITSNTKKEKFPILSIKNLKEYPTVINSYLTTNFGFRNFLLHLNAKLKVNLLGQSTNKLVLKGKNDWYFMHKNPHAGKDKNFELYTNRKVITNSEVNTLKQKLIKRQQRLGNKGISYYKSYFPLKHRVYSNQLPLSAQLCKVQDKSQLDIVNEELSVPGLSYIDVTAKLIEISNKTPVFLKNDIHWNEMGAFVAYQEILKKLAIDFPLLKYHELTDYNIKWYENNKEWAKNGKEWCDGMCYTYYPETINESNIYKPLGLFDLMGLGSKSVNSFSDKIPVFKGKEKFEIEPIVFGGGALYYKNNKASTRLKAIVFRDSYSTDIIKFFLPHFSEITFIWSPYMKQYESKDVDIIIDMHVEGIIANEWRIK